MRSWAIALRIAEFIAIFCCSPLILYYYRHTIAHKIVLIIMLIGALSWVYLMMDPSFDRRMLWRRTGQQLHLRKAARFFIVPALLLLTATYFFAAPHFLAFPKQKPLIWLMIMLFYPVLAAYPQELFFRGFFFQRYRILFPNPNLMILVNGVCFGVAHIQYGNWVAPVLSTLGGFLFASRYVQSNSLLTVGMEHALWGNYLFTIGIGWYFYSGAIQ